MKAIAIDTYGNEDVLNDVEVNRQSRLVYRGSTGGC